MRGPSVVDNVDLRALLTELVKPGLTAETAAKILESFGWIIECKRDRSGDRRWSFRPPDGWMRLRNRTKFRGHPERGDTIMGSAAPNFVAATERACMRTRV